MKKLNSFRYLKNLVFLIIFTLVFKFNAFAQTYHDCTKTQDFKNFLEQNRSSEEILDLMELEFAKSLSKFDKCVDSDYLETKNKEDRNELKNYDKVENSREESTEKKERDSDNTERELVEQKAKGKIEGLAENKIQKIDKLEGQSEKTNNDYNFSSKSNNEEFLNNKNTTNNKIVDSVASSELSGTEINKENLESATTFENNISEDSTEYEYDRIFEKEEKNNGIIPEDIPQDDNDSVLEEQIRLAAINEKDPEKKKRLWNEYRKYKGLPQKE